MRHITITIFLSAVIALSLVSCTDRDADRIMDRAEAIMYSDTDSAMQALDNLATTINSLPKSQRMRYALLYTEGKNKLNMDIRTDTIMIDVANYYSIWGPHYKYVKSLYLLGSIFRDRKETQVSLKYFADAAHEIENNDGNKDMYELLSRIYGQMLYLHWTADIPSYTIECGSKSARMALLSGDTLSYIIAHEYIADAYELLGENDSVMSICRKMTNILNQTGNTGVACRGFMTKMAKIYLNRHDYKKAGLLINEIDRGGVLNFADTTEIKSTAIYNDLKGRYYEGIGKLDSARIYYMKMAGSRFANCRLAAYKGMTSVCKKEGKISHALAYSEKYNSLNDSVNIIKTKADIAKLQSIYDYNHAVQKLEKAEQESVKLRFTIILILAIILIAGYTATRIYKRRVKRAKESIYKQNLEYNRLLSRYVEVQKEYESIKNDIKALTNAKEEELSQLQKTIDEYNECKPKPEEWDKIRSIYTSEFIIKMHSTALHGKELTQEEITSLEHYIKYNLPKLYKIFTENQDNLTDKEKEVLLLTGVKFLPSEISTLINITPQRVTNIRTILNQKLFKVKGAKSFTRNVLSVR